MKPHAEQLNGHNRSFFLVSDPRSPKKIILLSFVFSTTNSLTLKVQILRYIIHLSVVVSCFTIETMHSVLMLNVSPWKHIMTLLMSKYYKTLNNDYWYDLPVLFQAVLVLSLAP